MARYEHLPIFKRSYELALTCEEVVRGFSRYHKYGLGQELRDNARAILIQVVRVNGSWDKLPEMDKLRLLLVEMQVVARLCKDTRAFPNFKAFERVSLLVQDIARQSEGWRKSEEAKARAGADGVRPESPSPRS